MVFPVITPLSIRLGVVGAGTMGSGIALAALLADIPVHLYDVNPEVLARAAEYIDRHLERKGKAVNNTRFSLTSSLEKLRDCNLVIEAAPEDLALKADLFARLDTLLAPTAILATNTSTLSVTTLAARTANPQRVAGMHFFNPAPVLPLVELVQGARTSTPVLQTLDSVARLMGKTPVLTLDRPGFIVNRVARPYYGEALRLLGENAATIDQIDWIMQASAGFPMGPFRLMDLIGLDINAAAMASMYDQTFAEPRYRPHWIQQQMLHQGALGRKTGHGFYEYPPGASLPNPPDPPRAGRNSGNVWFSPGRWAPNLAELIQKTGYSVSSTPSMVSAPVAAFCVADKKQNLFEDIAFLDSALPPEVPLFVHANLATAHELSTQMHTPHRLAMFDSLFAASGSLLTLSAGPLTSTPIQERADQFWASLGRFPLWVADTPALIAPRLLATLANEAAFAVLEGVAPADTIDLAMRLGVNYPFGPLEWARRIGFTHILAILDFLHAEYHEDRYRAAPNLRRWSHLETLKMRFPEVKIP